MRHLNQPPLFLRKKIIKDQRISSFHGKPLDFMYPIIQNPTVSVSPNTGNKITNQRGRLHAHYASMYPCSITFYKLRSMQLHVS